MGKDRPRAMTRHVDIVATSQRIEPYRDTLSVTLQEHDMGSSGPD